MKRKKSLFGFLADKNNPISLDEIVQGLRDARVEDEDELDSAMHLSNAWQKYCETNHIQGTFSEYVKWLKSKIE
jgi:hypothetical protein